VDAIIDCDIHPLVRGGQDALREYMSSRDRAVLDERRSGGRLGHTARPMNRYMNPAPGIVRGALRHDAVPPDGGDPGSDPEFAASDLLDRNETEAALMIPLPYGAWLDPLGAGPTMAAMNSYFIDQWSGVDARFKLAAGVFALDTRAAAEEIERRAADDSVAAVFVPLMGMLLGHPHYYPIYEAASRAGLAVIVHPSGAEGTYPIAPALAGGLPATYSERHVALAQVGIANVASLVLSGTFDRFPELRVVFAEYGYSWAAPLAWRMEHEVAKGDAGHLKKRPTDYLREHVRFCTQPVEEPDRPAQMRELIEMMGGDETLLFSTDYPHWDNDNPARVFQGLDGPLKRRVFYENAKSTFAGRL
jgi:uncharacterized protein